MPRKFAKRLLDASVLGSALALASLSQASTAEQAQDVIARVGDQTITFSEINTMLNSSAVVGVSIPALGTPQRDTVRITLLDKMVSANLIYLDALEKGLDQDPEYQKARQRFAQGILADLYIKRHVMDGIQVSDQEVEAFFENNAVPDSELTDEARAQIEATLRKRKVERRQAELADELREGYEIVIHEQRLSPEGDEQREPQTPLAHIDGEPVTWGQVRTRLIAAGRGALKRDELAMESEARRRALEAEIDQRILARKAREAGLESDPVYQARVNEYFKTRLINLHRQRLAQRFEPSGKELREYYAAHRAEIRVPETRKVQEVLLGSREEAEALKARLEAGELTMWEAARNHSIAPGAEKTLGEIGWVSEGRALKAIDEVVFDLGPDEIGGPVQSPRGWHLVRVMDVRDARFEDIEDPQTQQRTRRAYIHDKLAEYTTDLRRNHYDVQVYEDVLVRLSQQEADMVGDLARQSREPGSVTEERLKELQKYLQP